jgi:predicted DNA-binding ribbon-helix-helix protein
MRRTEKNIIIAHRRTSLALEVYFRDCLKVILTYEQITLDEFCMLAVQHRQNSGLSSAVRLMIEIYFRTLANVRL